MKNEDIVTRFEHLVSERVGAVEGVWDQIERFVLPLRSDFYATLSQEASVDWDRREIYDSTAIAACQSLAASIQGNLVSMGQRWFNLTFREDELQKDDAAMEWLDEVADRIYRALDEANFDVEVAEAFLDLVGYGTTVITEEIDEKGNLIFAAIPIRECYFEEDHQKQIFRVYRRLQWTPVQILSKFGDDTPEQIKELAKAPNGSTEKKTVIFVIYHREGKDNVDTDKPIPPNNRPVGYKYIYKDTQELLGKEGGYYEMPAYVARWRKTAGSKWGHSPATIALADILTLNQIKEATLEAAGKAIDPPNLAEDQTIIGDIDLERGGLTIMTDIDKLVPYESGSKFDVSNLEISMLTNAIREYFFQDKLELKESPAMTATEVNVRYELMQRLLGPVYGRIKTDLLDPMIQRTFNVLYRDGQLPDVPDTVNAADLDVEYSGPLALAQKATIAEAITRFFAESAQLAELFPEAADILDVDGSMREIARLRGVPAKALKSEEDVEEEREKRQEQQQQMQQIQTAQEAGGAMQAIGDGAQKLQGVNMGSGQPPAAEAEVA